MPTNLNDVETGGVPLIFPENMEGARWRLKSLEVHSALEVREDEYDDPLEDGEDAEEEGQPPAYGRWLPVDVEGDEGWVNCPKELIDDLQALDPSKGEVFEVTRVDQGSRPTDPYEINLERRSNDTQTRL